MITIYHKTVKDTTPKVLENFKTGVWIDVIDPNDIELSRLANELSLEHDLLKDALDIYEVPRLEKEDGIVYVFTRVPYQDDNKRVLTIPMLVVLGTNFVLTLSREAVPAIDKLREAKVSFSTTQKTKLFLQIFSEINSAYTSFLTFISRRVRSLSSQIEQITNREISQFVSYEAVLNDFLGALIPTNSILNMLLSRKTIALYEGDVDLVEDLVLGSGQLIELAKSNLKNIVNIREAYATILTNNLNQVLKLLTSLTIILTVPMIISSFYGMNVTLPFADSPFAFVGIISITLGITLALLITFIRNRWL